MTDLNTILNNQSSTIKLEPALAPLSGLSELLSNLLSISLKSSLKRDTRFSTRASESSSNSDNNLSTATTAVDSLKYLLF